MGLDMYLSGKEHYDYKHRKVDSSGFELEAKVYRLGYWRKHPNLHGYIVQKFADGKDECQEIYLDEDNLKDILNASESDALPETTGFFFGASQPEDKVETKEILEKAIAWLEAKSKVGWRDVVYRASW